MSSSWLSTVRKKLSLLNPLRLFYHRMLAILALLWYRFPSEELTVICVTGTNGKTSTCHFIAQILSAAGLKVGMTTTALFRLGDDVWENNTKMTTLSPWFTQGFLRRMVQEKCQVAIIETSSHAITMNRLYGVNYDVAVVTNVTSDHLDLHGTLEHYRATKEKLFSDLNSLRRKPLTKKVSVINLDDPIARRFGKYLADQKIEYGENGKADLKVVDLVYAPAGTTGAVVMGGERYPFSLPIPGPYNVSNALAAIGAALAVKIPWEKILAAVAQLQPAPGRLELVSNPRDLTVVVDYAHTGDALEKLLSVFNKSVRGRIILVFGATGDRDPGRRPALAAVAERLADLLIVTDDDPYTEDHLSIIRDICQSLKRPEGEDLWVIPDRRLAIRTAIKLAEPGDVVVIAGKGCEKVQITNEGSIPWSDRQIAEEYLAEGIE